ncbi:hypothetical protein ACH5RR_027666 [Cinchona calisaya]|uniref:CCT domain-containing protein n=1 Tax=Cinchona calisaya TaxID=153742 RepID=A0ABD2YLJ1_9GENT
MASFSQYYSDYICSSSEFSELPTPIAGTASAVHGELVTFPNFSDSGEVAMVPNFDSDMISSSSSMSMEAVLFPKRLGVSDMTVPAKMLNYDRAAGLLAAISGNECFTTTDIDDSYRHDRACDFGDQECSFLASNFLPLYPITADNWEIQGGAAQRVEESTFKVARYSAEERKDRIVRYLKKRSQRNFNKTIKYACRKTLADKRVRVRGRFAKNNELCEDDQTLVMNTDYNNLQETERSHYHNPVQTKHHPHDEEWLQEAIASLMYYRMLPDNIMELPD